MQTTFSRSFDQESGAEGVGRWKKEEMSPWLRELSFKVREIMRYYATEPIQWDKNGGARKETARAASLCEKGENQQAGRRARPACGH